MKHTWVEFFKAHPCRKIKLLRYSNEGELPAVCADAVDYFEKTKMVRPGSMGLFTYLGFQQDVTGWAYRDLSQKFFLDQPLRDPLFYPTQAFEDQQAEYRRQDPIVVLEGILDAESCSVLTGYPWIIGCLSASVSTRLAMFLSLLTDRVLLIPDNDKSGKSGLRKSTVSLELLGVRVGTVIEGGAKDIGDVYRAGPESGRRFALKFAAALETLQRSA